jgi:predicted transcriptional regulator
MPREISYEKVKQLEDLYKINLGLGLSKKEIERRTGLDYPVIMRYFNSIEEFYNNLGEYKATALRKNVFPYAKEHKKNLEIKDPRVVDLIRAKLDEMNMTQKELAKKIRVKPHFVYNYINQGVYSSKISREKILKVLNINQRTIEDFLK